MQNKPKLLLGFRVHGYKGLYVGSKEGSLKTLQANFWSAYKDRKDWTVFPIRSPEIAVSMACDYGRSHESGCFLCGAVL